MGELKTTDGDGFRLTERQRKYANFILANHSKVKSFELAGYSMKGSQKSLYSRLDKVANHPEIVRYINENHRKSTEAAGINAERVSREIAHYAFLDPARLFAKDGSLLEVREMDEDVRRAIASIDVKQIGHGDNAITETKLKLIPKDKGLEQLGKWLGMFVDRKEVTVTDLSTMTDDELQAQEEKNAEKWNELERMAKSNGMSLDDLLGQDQIRH